jgi:protease I
MKRIAILVEKDFQDLEVYYPFYRMKEEGFEVLVLGTGTAHTYFGKYGISIRVDADVADSDPAGFSAVIIPGGWAPDHLRVHDTVIQFVRTMYQNGSIIASICHGGWVLASADIVNGKKVTSYRAIKDDLIHAGALFEDKEVVQDKNLITSRKPDDLPAFCRAIIDALGGK